MYYSTLRHGGSSRLMFFVGTPRAAEHAGLVQILIQRVILSEIPITDVTPQLVPHLHTDDPPPSIDE